MTTFERFGFRQKQAQQTALLNAHNNSVGDPNQTAGGDNTTTTVTIVGSTLSSDHPKEYDFVRKGCFESSVDMLFRNGKNKQFNDSHYILLNSKENNNNRIN